MDYYALEPWGIELATAIQARQTWATFQAQTSKELAESKYRLKFYQEPAKPLTPAEYKAKSMARYKRHGGIIPEGTNV